jgi:hypothetical protein
MSVVLISDKARYQGLSTDTKPTDAVVGAEFFEEDTGKKFRKGAAGWVAEATEILGDSGFPIDDNHPLPVGGDSLYAKNIDVAGSDIGTFTGDITDLVDNLDATIIDTSATNPKYFEIKLNRPVDNTSIKFCSPTGKNFSNVKIILKDRAGTTVGGDDDSANNTDYPSNSYNWDLVPWCTIRVEFHTADEVQISWALINRSQEVHTEVKLVDKANSTETPLLANAEWTGEWKSTINFVQGITDINTDQDSATDGFKIELGNDGISAIHTHSFTILANEPDGHHYPSVLENKFYRLRYKNGGTDQGTFKLASTLFNSMVEEGHTHNLDFSLQDDHPAPVVRNVNAAKTPGGDYINIGATTGGNLKSSTEELDDTVRADLNRHLDGAGSNGAVTLTDANTAYAVPTVAPTKSYRITLNNKGDTSIFVGYQNSNANGVEIPPGDSAYDNLGAGQQLYAYCGSAGKVLTYTYKEVL